MIGKVVEGPWSGVRREGGVRWGDTVEGGKG
jgi:hypothetical protein